MDNYYTSYPLASYHLEYGLTVLWKKNPPEFFPSKSHIVEASLFGFQEDTTMVSYVPKKIRSVILLSTMHNTVDIDEVTKKVEIIMSYNRTKCGVKTY